MKKIKEILMMSATISFCLTFFLMLINAIMGVFVGLGYYFIIFTLLMIGFVFGLTLVNLKKILMKKKKPTKANKSIKKVKSVNKSSKRKIS